MAYTTIDNPELYFQTKLFTGNASTQSITLDGSENMQPDWVWFKNRNAAQDHAIFDSVRGVQKQIKSNTTEEELTRTNALSSFDSNGFSIGDRASLNGSGNGIASWNWKAGGSASSNSNGSITSSVSSSTDAGFSIVSYTGTGSGGQTVGHSLGVKPKVLLIKNRSGSDSWIWWQDTNNNGTGDQRLILNGTNASDTSGNFSTSFQNTTFTLPSTSDTAWSGSSANYIAYCFAEKKGYSKFGSYTGNGSLDAPFIGLGFKPAWLIIKRTDTTNSWVMFDNKRNAFNVVDKHLFANTSDPEDSSANYNEVDFLSNGFKLREDNNTINASGGTYIYMAFAENPFVTSTGVPATAR